MSVDYGDSTIFDQYKNECWLRERIHLDPASNLPNNIWLVLFWQVESHLIQTSLKKLKISANSNSQNVQKQVDPYGSIPVVSGLESFLW